MNQLTVVGRLIMEPTKFDENLFIFSIGVPRRYKNDKEEYDTDNIKCLITNTMKDNLARYINIGDIIAVKGYLTTINDAIYAQVEKVTFLATKGE